MLVKAASHLRPILRLQGLLNNSSSPATSSNTSTTPPSSLSFSSTSSSTQPSSTKPQATRRHTSQAFTSNATLLTQAQVQNGQCQIAIIPPSVRDVGHAWTIGSNAGTGSGRNDGKGAGKGEQAGNRFAGYTGFGRSLTQASTIHVASSQQQRLDEETKHDPLVEIKAGRPSSPKSSSSSRTGRRASWGQAEKVNIHQYPEPSSPTVSPQRLHIPSDISIPLAETAAEDPELDVPVAPKREHRLRKLSIATTDVTQELTHPGLWTVGLRGGKFVKLPMRNQIASRTYSTKSVLPPPFLAGSRDDLDVSSRLSTASQIRRNSTSTAQDLVRTGLDVVKRTLVGDSESVQDQGKTQTQISKKQLSAAEQELKDRLTAQDESFQKQCLAAIKQHNRTETLRLVEAYRNPRALNSDPAVSSATDVDPPYFTQAAYNVVLSAYLTFREPGEPITQVLRSYNEMLERDILPSSRTYSLVIRALMQRHEEVEKALIEAKGKRKWIEWDKKFAKSARSDGAGAADYNYPARDAALKELESQMAQLEGEKNYENAVKLFHSGVAYNRHRPFQTMVYAHLLRAAAARGEIQVALQVFGHLEGVRKSSERSNSNDGKPLASFYAFLSQAYAKQEDGIAGMQQVLQTFLEDEKKGDILDGRTGQGRVVKRAMLDKSGQPLVDSDGNAKNHVVQEGEPNLKHVIPFFDTLLHGYATLGDMTKVNALLDIMRRTTKEQEIQAGQLVRVNSSTATRITEALCEGGHLEDALAFVENQYALDNGRTTQRAMTPLLCGLLDADRSDLVLRITAMNQPNKLWVAQPFIRRAIVMLVTDMESKIITAEQIPEVVRSIIAMVKAASKSDDVLLLDHLTMSSLLAKINSQELFMEGLEIVQIIGQQLGKKNLPVFARDFNPVRRWALKQATTLEDKLLLAVLVSRMDSSKDALDSDSSSDLIDSICKIAANGQDLNALLEPIGQPAVSALVDALVQKGSASSNLLTGDHAKQFDTDLQVILKGLGQLQGTLALRIEDIRVLISVLQQRLGKEKADSIATEVFNQEKVASILADTVTLDETSSFIASPTSGTSNLDDNSTAPTELFEDQTQPRYEISGHASKSIDRHHGPKPTLSPIQAYEILKDHLSKSIVPFPGTISRLIVALGRLGFEDKVAELYHLGHESIKLTATDQQLSNWFEVENGMISACCFLGQLEKAGLHRAAIINQGLVPTADAYATMISSAKDTTDDASVARELWDESQRLGVRANLFLYNTFISKLSRARKAETALEYFMEMKSKKIKPSSVTYGAVINACCRVGDTESATTLFEEMRAQASHKPRVPPYNTMMQLHLQTDPSRELVLHYYNQLVQAEIAPSAHTYKLLLDAYGTLQPIDLAAQQQVFENLCNDPRVSVAGTHWASLIYAAGIVAGQPKRAIEIFESIPSHRSTRPHAGVDSVCWEALMSVLAEHKMVDEMTAYTAKMHEQGVRVTAYVNNMLIKGYSNVGQIEKSREVFEAMGDSSIGVAAPNNHPALLSSSGQVKPTSTTESNIVFREPSTYEAMIRAEIQAGNLDAARTIGDRMEARMYPIAVTTRIRALIEDLALEPASSPTVNSA